MENFYEYLIEKYGKYPYFNTKNTITNSILDPIRRSLAFINPFAEQQIPTVDSLSFSIRKGGEFYVPDPYPERTVFKSMLPVHFDPVKEQNSKNLNPLIEGTKSLTANQTLDISFLEMPKACAREFKKFNRCKIINGKDKCKEEMQNTLEICPNFVLKGKKNFLKHEEKIKLIMLNDFKKALTVSDYNINRSVKDVDSRKDKSFGSSENLRPNSLWADERYSQVTPEEIEQAKKRLEAKGKGIKFGPLNKPYNVSEIYGNYKEPSSVYLNKN